VDAMLKQVVTLSNIFASDADLFKLRVGPGAVSKWVNV